MTNQSLSETALATFFAKYKQLVFFKNELILKPNTPFRNIYYLESGVIRQFFVTKSGDELTLYLFQPGSMVFLLQTLNNRFNNYYFEALTEVRVRSAPLNEVMEFVQSNPEAINDFLIRIGRGFSEFLTKIESLAYCNCREKLATILLILAKRFGQQHNGSIRIELPLTHSDLANMIGVTRETTSVELKKFEREGLIERDKKITIIKNVEGMRELATLVPD